MFKPSVSADPLQRLPERTAISDDQYFAILFARYSPRGEDCWLPIEPNVAAPPSPLIQYGVFWLTAGRDSPDCLADCRQPWLRAANVESSWLVGSITADQQTVPVKAAEQRPCSDGTHRLSL